MFRLCVFAMAICATSAGLIGGLGLPLEGHGLVAAPLVTKFAAPVAYAAPVVTKIAAPIAVSHGAASWQNSNLVALNPTAVVAKVAAPVAVAPVLAHAPVSIGVAPLGLGFGWGKGLALGGLH